jgi:hypothetical protein
MMLVVSFAASDATSLTIVRFFFKPETKEVIADMADHDPVTYSVVRVLSVSPVAHVFRFQGCLVTKAF